MGPSEETLIAELRIVAMATDPPVVEPLDPFQLTITVADPLGEGGDLLVWACVPDKVADTVALESACVSDLQSIDADQLTVDQLAIAPLPLWALACAPGLCGDLSSVPEARLQDPIAWLQELPISGVSAGFKLTPVAQEGDDPPAVNPKLLTTPTSPVVADPVDGTELTFVAQGAATAYGYATAGGFSAPSYDVSSEGDVTLTWFAAEEQSTPARLYVVFEDGRGGVEVWLGDGAQ